MTSILENELVKKYFSPIFGEVFESCKPFCIDSQYVMAFKVLLAMQEPIKAGEKVLYIQSDGSIVERIGTSFTNNWDTLNGFHAYYLRLPDRFQPSSDKKECGKCQGYCCSCCPNNQLPPVSEKKECKCTCHIHEQFGYPCRCTQPPPNKFDEAVKRSFEEDRIIEPGTVFEKPEKCRYNHGTGSVCDCAPDPAIGAKIEELLKEIGHGPLYYEKALRDLVELARRSDR